MERSEGGGKGLPKADVNSARRSPPLYAAHVPPRQSSARLPAHAQPRPKKPRGPLPRKARWEVAGKGRAWRGLGGRGCRGAGWAASGGGIADQPLLSALCPDWNEVKEEAKGSQRRT
ncbi:hypothetical protein [Paenibacillus timonensis]|uniref:hypothetical protein n=1 Tax=Paenibacillus timonensis TaxID=225915 RepID=UPI0022E3DE23|nr:hypothetical protein [Paenibacillus timonensis]